MRAKQKSRMVAKKQCRTDKVLKTRVSELDRGMVAAGEAAMAKLMKKIAATDVRDYSKLRGGGPSDEIVKLIASRM